MATAAQPEEKIRRIKGNKQRREKGFFITIAPLNIP
jgi:hypothetical protein